VLRWFRFSRLPSTYILRGENMPLLYGWSVLAASE
jgi:hypothetical protein